jgi:transcriptional regulator of acetoin/glycerol metabolism
VSQSGSHDIIDVDSLRDEIKAHYLQIKNQPLKGSQWQEMNSEKEKIQRLLMENRWNKSRVAEILDISRTALYKKLKKLNIQ